MALRILATEGEDTFDQPTCGQCRNLSRRIGKGSTVWVRPHTATDRLTGWPSDNSFFGQVTVLLGEAVLNTGEDKNNDGRTHSDIFTESALDKNWVASCARDFFLTY